MVVQADKLTTLINAAKVPEVEPIWASLFAKVRRIAYIPEETHGRTNIRHRLSRARMSRSCC